MVVSSKKKVKDSNFVLIVSSKNLKSFNNFLFFILKHIKTHDNLIKIFSSKNKIQKVSILKSPHVNKIAQEQFETRKFTKKILFNAKCIKLPIIDIKNTINKIFQDLKITIRLDQSISYNFILKTINFQNFKLKNIKQKCFNSTFQKKKSKLKNKFIKNKNQKILNLTNFLKMTSIKGEILTKILFVKSLNSSVGRAKD
jgi:ribosomal protein S10